MRGRLADVASRQARTEAGMAYEHVLVQHDGDFATITMNRPDRRNALSLEHMQELIQAFTVVGDSDALGIVLAGSGKVFCAGHDFADVGEADLGEVRRLLWTCTELMTLMQSVPQPVVAVARSVGRKRACELAMSGDVIDAATALQWGLVNRVVPPAQLDSATQDLLERVTRGSAESTPMGKHALYAQTDLDQPKAYAYAVEVMAATSQLPDAREGIAAFMDKRKPRWQGRPEAGGL